MDKQARLELCNRLSPCRFEKLAWSIKNLFKNKGPLVKKTFSNYINNLPDFDAGPERSFLGNLWEAGTSFFNPKKYWNSVKYGPGAFIKNLRETTFNKDVWKKSPFLNAFSTYWNVMAPYDAIYFATLDEPSQDLEGKFQKGIRNAMNFADVMDLSGNVMSSGIKGGQGWSSMIKLPLAQIGGTIAGRVIGGPIIGKALDSVFGTAPTKEVLQQRFMSRLEKETRKLIKNNPKLDVNEAQLTAMQDILQAYGPEATQKIFS